MTSSSSVSGVPDQPAVPVPGLLVPVRGLSAGVARSPRLQRLRSLRLALRHLLRRLPVQPQDVYLREGAGEELRQDLGVRAGQPSSAHGHRSARHR